MPRVLLLERPTALIARVYTPDFAVGLGGRNLRKDVLLVQFLVAAAQRKPEVSGGVTRDYSKSATGEPIPVGVDGVWGPRTLAGIRRYQELYDSGVKPDPSNITLMIHDGRVDPVHHTGLGPRQGHVLTIIRLNMLYRAQFGEAAHNRLLSDPSFPRELYDDFYMA